MLTKELIASITGKTGFSRKHAEEVLEATCAVIRENVCSGKSVTLQGLGSIEPKQRAERTIVHPKTGIPTVSPAKTQITFKPTATIKDEMKNI